MGVPSQPSSKPSEQNGHPDLDDIRDVLVRAAFAYYKMKGLPVDIDRDRVDFDAPCASKWRSLRKREQYKKVDVAELVKSLDPTSPLWGF